MPRPAPHARGDDPAAVARAGHESVLRRVAQHLEDEAQRPQSPPHGVAGPQGDVALGGVEQRDGEGHNEDPERLEDEEAAEGREGRCHVSCERAWIHGVEWSRRLNGIYKICARADRTPRLVEPRIMPAGQHALEQVGAETDAPQCDEQRVDQRPRVAAAGAEREGEPGNEDEVGRSRDIGHWGWMGRTGVASWVSSSGRWMRGTVWADYGRTHACQSAGRRRPVDREMVESID